MKEEFQHFKRATMQNGGEPLLQKTKQVVVFDPNNVDHMEAARLLFFVDDPMPERAKVQAHIDWCHRQEELKVRKSVIAFRFKLEAPYHDVPSMVNAKIVKWAMELHLRRMTGLPRTRVLKMPSRAVAG